MFIKDFANFSGRHSGLKSGCFWVVVFFVVVFLVVFFVVVVGGVVVVAFVVVLGVSGAISRFQNFL